MAKNNDEMVELTPEQRREMGLDATEAPYDPDELRAFNELDVDGDITWNITRVSDYGNKKAGYCGKLSTSDLSLEKIRQEWGMGKYRVRGTRANGQFARQVTVVIATDPERPAQEVVTRDNGHSITEYMQMMQEERRERAQSMKEWATILAPILGPIVAGMFSNKGASLAELTTALANMKQLSGEAPSTKSKLEELQEIVALAKELGGNNEKSEVGSTWVDLIRDGVKEIGPVLGSLVSAKMVPTAAPALMPINNPRPAPVASESVTTASPPPPQEVSADMNMQFLSWFREQLAGLVHQASRDKDPSLYAEIVLDNIPDGLDPKKVREFLGRADWWEMLTGFFPAAKPYQGWFKECHAELISGLDDMLNEGAPHVGETPANSAAAPAVNNGAVKPAKANKPAQKRETLAQRSKKQDEDSGQT